jgi:hypothetical protein
MNLATYKIWKATFIYIYFYLLEPYIKMCWLFFYNFLYFWQFFFKKLNLWQWFFPKFCNNVKFHINKFSHYQISQFLFPKFYIIYLSFSNEKKNSKIQYFPHLIRFKNNEITSVGRFSPIGWKLMSIFSMVFSENGQWELEMSTIKKIRLKVLSENRRCQLSKKSDWLRFSLEVKIA